MTKIQIKNEKTIILEKKSQIKSNFIYLSPPTELLLFIKYNTEKVRPPIAPSLLLSPSNTSHILIPFLQLIIQLLGGMIIGV